MKKYLYEMHLHTVETSRCAEISAKKAIEYYIEKGYDGIVVTDHFSPSTFEKFEGMDMSWEEKVNYFLRGYHTAKKAAEGRINILLGMELRFDKPREMNDYLVYGVTEKYLYSHPQLLDMNIRDFSKSAHKHGMVIFQAHPFRTGMRIVKPKYLDGIEIYNGNPRHNSSNDIAEMWAKKYDLRVVGGSDFHEFSDLARGGVYFDKEIKDSKTLVKELLNGDYEIKRTE